MSASFSGRAVALPTIDPSNLLDDLRSLIYSDTNSAMRGPAEACLVNSFEAASSSLLEEEWDEVWIDADTVGDNEAMAFAYLFEEYEKQGIRPIVQELFIRTASENVFKVFSESIPARVRINRV